MPPRPLMSPDHAQPGNGLLPFFRVDDFDMAVQRSRGTAIHPYGVRTSREVVTRSTVR